MLRLVIAIIPFAACGRIDFDPIGTGATGDAMPCSNFGPWSTPVKLDLGVDQGNENGAWLSPDGQDLWYSVPTALAHARRTGTSSFAIMDMVDLQCAGCAAWLSDDQLRIWYNRFLSTNDIFVGRRASTTDPFVMDHAIYQTGLQEGTPALTSDERTMILFESTGGSSDATRRLYEATRTSTAVEFSPATLIAELDVGQADFSPSLDREGLTMYWIRGLFGSRIETATRPDLASPWQFTGELDLIPGVSSLDRPFVTRDGLTMILTANVNGPTGDDLYLSQRACL